MIAQTLLSVAFAYLTTKNPNGKFLQCFGCCMTEGEIPQNITPPGTGVEYNFHSSNQPPVVLEENFTRDLEAAAGVIQGVGKESEKDTSKAFKYEELVAATNGFAPSNLFGSGGFRDGVQEDHSRGPCGGEAAQNRKSSR
ncbi:unnamed protein product [Calypogeia fissa]